MLKPSWKKSSRFQGSRHPRSKSTPSSAFRSSSPSKPGGWHPPRLKSSVDGGVEFDFDLPNSLIVVTKRLPLIVKRNSSDGDVSWDISRAENGPIAESVHYLREKFNIPVTCVGMLSEEVPPSEEAGLNARLSRDFDCIPVHVKPESADLFTRFCKTFLWPLLNSQLCQGSREFSCEEWDGYVEINRAFARTISRFAGSDVFWIHDYHLLPLAHLLREAGFQSNRIGLFLHSPFPTSEIFRIIPVRDELLRFVGGADLIGFQTYHDMRHFMSACTRILAVDAGQQRVNIGGREVTLGIHPTGADPAVVRRTRMSLSTQSRIAELRKAFGDVKIIAGRDRLDQVKGIPQKLRAYEDLLIRYPEWRGKVVLLQSCTAGEDAGVSGSGGDAGILSLEEEINILVAEINGRWAQSDFVPIHFLSRQHVPYEDIVAILSAADACLLTSLRDGMNLTAHEYVLAQEETYGPLILSEFAGSSQSLPGALRVNPWDTKGVADALHLALGMEEKERRIKHRASLDYCKKNTSTFWAASFLDTLMGLCPAAQCPPLFVPKVVSDFGLCSKRVLLLDYDGTLVPLAARPSLALPNAQVLQVLSRLCADRRNTVFLVSGRPADFMMEHFGSLPVGLMCEHGVLYRPAGEGTREVVDLSTQGMEVGSGWKEVVMEIFSGYTEVTPRTWVEEKQHCLAWHYRDADEEFALFQVKELCVHLQNVASGLPVEVVSGNKVVEVHAQAFNKGTAVRHILNEVGEHVDFLLGIGDDRTDEHMFQAVNAWADATHHTAYSIAVDTRDTVAKHSVATQDAVLPLLNAMAKPSG